MQSLLKREHQELETDDAANDPLFAAVKYISRTKIDIKDALVSFALFRDNAGRFWPSQNTQFYVTNYLENFRQPSRNWPYSYLKALTTQKFAKVVVENEPDLAVKLRIAHKVD